MELVAEAATIPFQVLPLIGRRVEELPGHDQGAWECLGEWADGGATAARWRYAAGRGRVDGRPVPMHVLARALNGIVWAVGVWVPGFLILAQAPERAGEPDYLVAIPRPDDAIGSLNWIVREGDRRTNLGLSP
jgi:hypothetical protein